MGEQGLSQCNPMTANGLQSGRALDERIAVNHKMTIKTATVHRKGIIKCMSSPRGQFAYGRVDPREAGRAAGLRSGVARRTKALVMELVEGDAIKQVANATELLAACAR
jgi:hypothetical protein